jgi:phospholipase C
LAWVEVNPRRLDPSNIDDVLTCSQDHEYPDEQKVFDGGRMDEFVTSVRTAGGTSGTGRPCQAGDTMNYYDGDTVTGMWPSAREVFVDHTLTDQSSILKFVEDNWSLPKIDGSFDAIAGSLDSMFDFHRRRTDNSTLFLDPVTGQPSTRRRHFRTDLLGH